MGEKDLESSDTESDDFADKDGMMGESSREGASNINHLNDHKDQGLQSADVVIGGEKIKLEDDIPEKKKKKIAQQEAKRKRDEMVGKMIKATEQGLGAFADFMERMQKYVNPVSSADDH